MIYPQRHGCHIGELWEHRDDEPRCVPETLMFGLETLEWRNYRGWNVEKQLATFLLKHSFHLKKAIFSSVDTNLEDENEIFTELALLPRGSTTCQLVFS
ncbi:hypothetical protein ARALYDRAFT_918787 [Arabidopsis lyrata subsp. lyrata]|uniref:FBD domain-containing protein n=1 Tax=Arabidopsis lyrata subsp. lyrata TaxID=81972 RepID=D7MLQ9_ARALL|nr:hypothetical protein ARALYDRAFT_918787 [Arabidopsis lyrata subsp. lyrata]